MEKVQKYLDNFKVIPYDLKKVIKVYFNTEYVNLNDLNTEGKKNGDNFGHVVLVKDGSNLGANEE